MSVKRWIIFTMLVVFLAQATVAAQPDFQINARAAVLMDPLSGRVLFAQDEHKRLPPASVTKIMTMLLILEAVHTGRVKWEEPITTSPFAAYMGGSQVYLKEGEVFPLREMFKAIAVVSANDASAAVAEHLYGSVQDFVDQMNREAKRLNLKDTHFANETGLPDPEHYSSAYDLAVISRELIAKYPEVLEYTSIWMDKFRDGQFILKNTNDLLKSYRGADGLKTGHTDEAKFCLSGTAIRDNFRLISVILGAETNPKRVAETQRLLDYGYRNYQLKVIKDSKQAAGQVYIREAQKREVPVKVDRAWRVVVERGQDQLIRTEVVPDAKLKFPIAAGAKVGLIKATLAGKEIARAPVFAMEKVNRANVFTRGWRWFVDFLGSLFRKKVK